LKTKNKVRPRIKEKIKCGKCGSKMEFYGVESSGGKKYNCPSCFEKIVVRSE
jgi:DNA-directed RNA polymerase subunit RPC12/RpoP